MHKAGWIHRDIKLENVLLCSDKRTVVIGDLGFACQWNQSTCSPISAESVPPFLSNGRHSGLAVGRSRLHALFGARNLQGKDMLAGQIYTYLAVTTSAKQ